MNQNVEMLERFILAALDSRHKESPPSENQFVEIANSLREGNKQFIPVSDEEYAGVLRRLRANVVISMDVGIFINDRNSGHKSWLPASRADINFFFWNRYKNYLEINKNWNTRVTASLDRVSDEIVDLLGNPQSGEAFQRRGLVLGDVQSGKTANYTAICNKAADTGYRIIIVLAGMLENLRTQTQERMDAEFAGRKSEYYLDPSIEQEIKNQPVGVGRYGVDRRIASFTSVVKDFDIEIFINSEVEIFALASSNNIGLTSRERIAASGVPKVCVLPQIVPLLKREELVSPETLRRNKFSKRTSRNFRNSLMANKDEIFFDDFKKLIENTWHGIKINELTREENVLILQLRERAFATEIYNMGHGVQMWLQTMWFITCAGKDAIIVLDEPDVYMHADLQRRLMRLLKNQYNQTIIATHSIEIISEVQPRNILIVNRRNEETIFADNYPVLQTAISNMGSIHNIHLPRLLNNKKYIFVEGNDKDILKALYDTLFPGTAIPLDHITSVSTGGWGSWEVHKVTAKNLMSEVNDLKIYFLYDRDYHTDKQIDDRKESAKDNQINLHIWSKKEIENYLIIPTAIARLIRSKVKSIPNEQLVDEIGKMIENICEDLKEETLDNLIDEAKKTTYKKSEYSTIKKELKPAFDEKWKALENRISLVSGKTTIRRLSDECKNKYNVSFGSHQVASYLLNSEISVEVKKVLTAIKDGVRF